MDRYSKLIAGAVGLGVIAINPWAIATLGMDISGSQQVIVDAVLSALTAYGIYAVPNA